MYFKTNTFHLIVFLLVVVTDVLSNISDRVRDAIDAKDHATTTCFRVNDAQPIDTNVLSEDIKSVDGGRFYAFLVKIGWTSATGEVSFLCGGTLISDKYVLSVAHCMEYERPMFKTQPDLVRIAEHRLGGTIIGEDISISNIHAHPLYGVLTMYDDIALIELSEKSRYRPACIWTGLMTPKTNVFALGHDLTRIGAQQVMSLELITNTDCDRRYSPSRKLPNGIVNAQICAEKSNITDPESCKGYIGGPLLTQDVENSDKVFVVGLTNYGRRCASSGFPNIYTKVSFYRDWIDETVNDK